MPEKDRVEWVSPGKDGVCPEGHLVPTCTKTHGERPVDLPSSSWTVHPGSGPSSSTDGLSWSPLPSGEPTPQVSVSRTPRSSRPPETPFPRGLWLPLIP